ncbi:MAG: molecular chaperone TorD family protein [Actinomycetota bacterium]
MTTVKEARFEARTSPSPRAGGQARAPRLRDLAEVRGLAYRLVSELFLYPDPERVGILATSVPELRRRSRPFDDLASAYSWHAMLNAVDRITDESLGAMAADHASLFLVGSAEASCPPCESAYSRRGGVEAGWITAQLELTYSMAGLTARTGAEPPDHIAVELGFVSVLCREEANAWQTDRPRDAGAWLKRQRAFLDARLVRWLPAFTARLSRVAPSSFYADLAANTFAYTSHDREFIAALSAHVSSLAKEAER